MAEKICGECNFVFSSQISYNIHLKTCKENINYDPKNKYFCPSCCRQFRIFDNLKRHEETKKHLELFNWEKKQLSDILVKDIQKSDPKYDPNVKVITLTRELILKENKVDIPNDINLDIKSKINKNLETNKTNQPPMPTSMPTSMPITVSDEIKEEEINFDKFDLKEDKLNDTDLTFDEFDLKDDSISVNDDTFLLSFSIDNNLENTSNNNLDLEKENINTDIITNIITNNVIEEDIPNNSYENFFEKLIKDRENMLKSFIKLPNESIDKLTNNLEDRCLSTTHTPTTITHINPDIIPQTNINESLLKEQIDEDTIDLKDEIIKTQQNLTFYKEYCQSELDYKTKLYGNDSLLHTIQNTRDNGRYIKNIDLNDSQKKINIIKNEKPNSKTSTNTSTNTSTKTNVSDNIKNRYPNDFKLKPIWKYLQQTIHETDYLNKINNLFVVKPFNDYLFLCTFILYSEDLDDKIDMRFKLISSIIELNKYFQTLLTSKKYIWNGKNVVDCVNLFNKLKINEHYSKCKNDLEKI